MAYPADELSGPYRNPDKVGICSPLMDADGDMHHTQPAFDGDIPPDPMAIISQKEKK